VRRGAQCKELSAGVPRELLRSWNRGRLYRSRSLEPTPAGAFVGEPVSERILIFGCNEMRPLILN
jgi:hypothetical protein